MMSRANQLPNLDKIFKDDDEQDFTPLGGSNLAAIFGTSNKTVDVKPVKKNQQKSSSAKSTPQKTTQSKTEVILAKAVHAYKLQNGQYTLIGKIGIALTGNTSVKTYLLILYRNNREHVSVVTLTPDFKFSIQENNYASYYDNNNENWSILFENNESVVEFAREIGISKYFLRQGKTDETIFCQDLTVGSKENEAKEGDNVHLKYTIITTINQPLKMSSLPVLIMIAQISTDDNWEKSLVGVTKGLKRILVLSPSKQIGLGPGFPRDRDIALDIEVVDIVPPEIKKSPSPKPIVPSGKASLISRMAKMGQSILPQKPLSTTTDSEDTEEEFIKSPRRLKNSSTESLAQSGVDTTVNNKSSQETLEKTPVQVPTNVVLQRNFVGSPNPSPLAALVPSPWPTASIPQYVTTADGQLYQFPAAMPQPTVPPAIDPNINIFLSETRTHNAEIRMGMSKIADNVQKLLDKFHVLEVQNAASPSNERALETSLKMLLSMNLNRNEAEKKLDPIAGDAELNVEKEKIAALEETLKTTRKTLAETEKKFEEERREFDKDKLFMREKIEALENLLSKAREELEESSSKIKTASDLEIQCRKNNATLEAKIITLEAENKMLSKMVNSKKTNLVKEQEKAGEIKQIMNKMYQALNSKFTEESYTTDYIKSTIANTIRTITLQCLKEKNEQESSASSDAEMKENVTDEVKVDVDSTVIDSEDDTIFLPNVNKSVDLEIDDRSNAQGPPPIPPMDLDVDNNWLP